MNVYPNCRWFQYSLRTLFVVMTLICVLFGTVVNHVVVPAERQRAAVKKIRGIVEYANAPTNPSWLASKLREHLPRDYFDSVIRVCCVGVRDNDLEPFSHFPQLQRLHLNRTPVNDAGLVHLRRLTQLKWLYLDGTQVTDVGLVNLSGLTQLQKLDLGRTQVTDAAIADLQQKLPNCKISKRQLN